MKSILISTIVALSALAPVDAESQDHTFRVERAGSGRAMILIPGLLSDGAVWRGTVERLGGEYDMHVLTLPGFAGVPATDADPFLATMRDEIIRYIREQKLDRPVLVGHSLGGFLALWIAATAPDLVGPVVAVDGVPFLSALGDTSMTPARMRPQAAAIRTAFAGMNSDALAAQTRMAMVSQVKDTAWHVIGSQWGAVSDAKTVGNAVAEMMTTDIRNDVAGIRAPVLLMMAGDGMTPDQRSLMRSRYAGQLAGVRDATVVVAEAARHFIMIDDPAFFHATVASFLAGR